MFLIKLFLYTVSWRCNRDNLYAGKDILFYIMFFIISTIKNIRHFNTTFALTIQKRSQSEPAPSPSTQSIICSYVPHRCSYFKFNIVGLILGTALNLYENVAKGLKLKVRKFFGLILTFVEVTREKW